MGELLILIKTKQDYGDDGKLLSSKDFFFQLYEVILYYVELFFVKVC